LRRLKEESNSYTFFAADYFLNSSHRIYRLEYLPVMDGWTVGIAGSTQDEYGLCVGHESNIGSAKGVGQYGRNRK